MKVEPVGEFELKGIRRPLAAYNVLTPEYRSTVSLNQVTPTAQR